MDAKSLTEQWKAEARGLGFARLGVCPAVTPGGISHFAEWLEAGYAGQMHYLPDRRDAYRHPRSVLEGVRSLLMLALDYRTAEPKGTGQGEGRISRYAWGTEDYHDLIRERLTRLAAWLRKRVPGAQVRGVVDTAPLLEREFAQLAGLGWIGKNTLLLSRSAGSWFFLASLLTDVELCYDTAHGADHCGTCRACLDACPTGAFPQPYVLDARRCISYLTIELRDPIPTELRPAMGNWVFGCDVCQEVCPWNGQAPASEERQFEPILAHNPLELTSLFELDDDAFRRRFRRSPLWRARRRGMLRNAAIALGNRPDAKALPALRRGLADPEPIVRGACAWALGRYRVVEARGALNDRRRVEEDRQVIEEIDAALEASASLDQGFG